MIENLEDFITVLKPLHEQNPSYLTLELLLKTKIDIVIYQLVYHCATKPGQGVQCNSILFEMIVKIMI